MVLGLVMKLNVFVRNHRFWFYMVANILIFIVKSCPPLLLPYHGITICKNEDLDIMFDYSPRNLTFMKNYDPNAELYTESMPIDTGKI
jgi:hypothetical protein